MEDDWTYAKTGPKRRLQHSNDLDTRRKKKKRKTKRPPGGERLKWKGQKQDGDRGRNSKWRPLRLTEVSGGTLWRPYVPWGMKRRGEVRWKHIIWGHRCDPHWRYFEYFFGAACVTDCKKNSLDKYNTTDKNNHHFHQHCYLYCYWLLYYPLYYTISIKCVPSPALQLN